MAPQGTASEAGASDRSGGCPSRAGGDPSFTSNTLSPFFHPNYGLLPVWPLGAPVSHCFPLQGAVTMTFGQPSLAGFICGPLVACFNGPSESAPLDAHGDEAGALREQRPTESEPYRSACLVPGFLSEGVHHQSASLPVIHDLQRAYCVPGPARGLNGEHL